MESNYEQQPEQEEEEQMSTITSHDTECMEELLFFKAHHTTAEYVHYCREQCIQGSIISHPVRRIIWYDILTLTSAHHHHHHYQEGKEELDKKMHVPERIPTLCEMMLSRCKRGATTKECNTTKSPKVTISLERQKQEFSELETFVGPYHVNKPFNTLHQGRRSASSPSRLQSSHHAEKVIITQSGKKRDWTGDSNNNNERESRQKCNMRRCALFISGLHSCTSHNSELHKETKEQEEEKCLCVLPENCQVRVVEADINRSLWNLYTETTLRDAKRHELKNVILRLLTYNYYNTYKDKINKLKERKKNVENSTKYKEQEELSQWEEEQEEHYYYYYQGLHEMIGFILYIFNPHTEEEKRRACEVCNQLIRRHWKVFTNKSLIHSQALLYALHSVICQEDTELGNALEQSGVGPESHYAVSWLITWYCHSVEDIPLLARLFDYFIAFQCCNNITATIQKNSNNDDNYDNTKEFEELGVVFFTAALMLHVKKNILQWVDKETRECEDEIDVDACNNDNNTSRKKKRKEELWIKGNKGNDKKPKIDTVMLMARVYSKLVSLPCLILSSSNKEEEQEKELQRNQVSSEVVHNLINNAEKLKRKHLNTVLHAQEVYLNQNVNIKKGVLAHPNTRNAALRKLWHLLPREWRNFVLVHHRKWRPSTWSSRTKWIVIGSLVVIAFALTWQYKQRE